jgi:hypothetical protein
MPVSCPLATDRDVAAAEGTQPHMSALYSVETRHGVILVVAIDEWLGAIEMI